MSWQLKALRAAVLRLAVSPLASPSTATTLPNVCRASGQFAGATKLPRPRFFAGFGGNLLSCVTLRAAARNAAPRVSTLLRMRAAGSLVHTPAMNSQSGSASFKTMVRSPELSRPAPAKGSVAVSVVANHSFQPTAPGVPVSAAELKR